MIITDNSKLLYTNTICNGRRIAAEHHMTVYINGKATMRLSCTPNNLGELVAGRLITEGLVSNPVEIQEIYISENGKIANVSVSKDAAAKIEKTEALEVATCCTMNYNMAKSSAEPAIAIEQVYKDFSWLPRLEENMLNTKTLFDETHATHSCFLAKPGEILAHRDDIGRHNALDKVIGWGIINGINMADCLLFTTGRMPEDMVKKAVRAGIPVLASKSFPTDRGVELACKSGLALITVRNNGEMTVWDNNDIKQSVISAATKNISAEELMKLDFEKLTLIDLREADEAIISEINGAINIPFSVFPRGCDEIPKDKPVISFCREGNISEDYTDYLSYKGYKAYSLSGGFNAYRRLKNKSQVHKSNTDTNLADKDKTFIVFSGDLDKTIAAFIMANGAATMGRNVTMFFTFWGLNILRKPRRTRFSKTFIEKLLSAILPGGTGKLPLSRMNMLGFGPRFIRGIMNKKGISTLEDLMSDLIKHGVKFVACRMSMEIMGIKQEELIEGVELGSVADLLASCEKSDTSLFI